MFCAALIYGAEHGQWWTWFITPHADEFLWRERDGGRWSTLDAQARAAWVTQQLLHSTAPMPEDVLALLHFAPGQTYGEVARRVQWEVSEEEAGGAPETTADETPRPLHVTIPRALLRQVELASDKLGITLDEAVQRALKDWVG